MTRTARLVLASALGVYVSACVGPSDPTPEALETSLYTLVQTIDGVALHPPLGPQPGPMTAAFDASLLEGMSVVLEATSAAGVVTPVATFDRRSSARLARIDEHSMYFVDVPAAPYFTNPALAYRFRVLSAGVELGRSDLSGLVFDILARNPALTIGVKVRVEQRPAPVLASLTPATAVSGGNDLTVTLHGAAFLHESVARFGDAELATTFVSRTELRATLPAAMLRLPGSGTFSVATPAPGGGTSAGVELTITPSVPTLGALTPLAAVRGSAALALTVSGASFAAGSYVRFGGATLSTTFVSDERLVATVPASALDTAGTPAVLVVNPGGGTSASASFTVNNPVPTLASITPASGGAASSGFTMTIDGAGFFRDSVVTFADSAVGVTYVSPSRLLAAIPASLVFEAGYDPVVVANAAPGGGASAPATYVANYLTPTLGSLSPASATLNGGDLTLTVNGTNFERAAQVYFNGAGVITSFSSATRLTAVVPSSLLSAAGVVQVIVSNPIPSESSSEARDFTIENPVPSLSTLTPASALEGGADLVLTLDGARFLPASTVTFDGRVVPSTRVSAGRLTAVVPAALVAAAGTPSVQVSNPAPGGGSSVNRTFTVNRPAPNLTSLAPATVTAGSAQLGLTIDGTGFVSGASATFDNTTLTTTFVSSTRLTATLTAGLLANGGTHAVAVSNPTPTIGASGALTFTVNNPVPTLASIAPTTANAGAAAFTLTLNGTGFAQGATATFNGVSLATTYVSSTRVTATVPAAQLSAVGTYAVTLTNPAPGGGASGAQTLTVNNPAPILSSISPQSATAGGPGFTLSAVGSSFTSSSQLSFGGVSYPTTYVSGGLLTASVPSAVLTSAGNYRVLVTNPAPGGGASAYQTFVVNATPANLNTSVTLGDGGANLYAGSNVVVGGNAVITIATNNTVNFGSLELQTGTSITTPVCTTAVCYCARINVAFDAVVHTGATINLDGKGYLGGRNGDNTSTNAYTNGNARISGQTNYYTGGAHGGYGGYISDYGLGFPQVYDDLYAPTLPGGGGNVSSTSQLGGNGGGCVHLIVGGTLQVDGSISANGQGNGSYVSGGAGGSIWIDANTIATASGGVIFQANGGSNSSYGSGGGGRVALYYEHASGWSPTTTYVQAYGGSHSNGGYVGGSGTIFYTGAGAVNGNLLLSAPTGRNSRYRSTRIGAFGTITALTNTVLTTADPQIPNALVGKTLYPSMYGTRSFSITANTETTITVGGGGLSGTAAVGERFYVSDYAASFDDVHVEADMSVDTGHLDVSGTLDVRDTARLTNYHARAATLRVRNTATMTTWDANATAATLSDSASLTAQNVTGTDLTLEGSATLRGWGAGNNVVYPMTIDEANVTVGPSATVTLNGLGYLGARNGANASTVGQVPSGINAPRNYYVGGHHGGWGGYISDYGLGWGDVYDDVYLPTLAGGGATVSSTSQLGGNGGGALSLTASNVLTLNGPIQADGDGGGAYVACGAGGSILINAGTIATTTSNTLLLHANGGSSCSYGSGGGGRIAIYYDALQGWSPSATTVRAYGGSNNNAGYNGGSGTIFYQGPGEQHGNLLLSTPSGRNSRYRRLRLGAFGTVSALTGTVLTTTDPLIPNALVGRSLVPNMYDGRRFTITGNTATTITVASGGLTAGAAVGNRFYVADYATTFDTVTLDGDLSADTGYLSVGTLEARNTTALSNFVTGAGNVLVRGSAAMTTWNLDATTYNLSDSATMTAQNITAGTLNLSGASVLTAWTPSAATPYPMTLTATEMTVGSAATITLAGLGYLGAENGASSTTVGQTAPGVTATRNYYVGGHHGGWGGYISDYGLGWGYVYDDVYQPTLPGGGGTVSSTSQVGGNGGGAIAVSVAGTLTLDGVINADGQGGSAYVSCGAGGAILIEAGVIASAQPAATLLHANGGSSCSYGSGGGGRIAFYYGALQGWTPSSTTVQAYGGSNGNANYNGGSGTIYYLGAGGVNGDLLLTTPTGRNSRIRPTRIGAFGTITALTNTVLTTADPQIPGALVGQMLVANMNNGTQFNITANTETTITVATGGLTAAAAVGNRFYVESYATRFDNLTLDGAFALDTGYLDVGNTVEARNTSSLTNYVTHVPTLTLRNGADMTAWDVATSAFGMNDASTMTVQNVSSGSIDLRNTSVLSGWASSPTAVYPVTLTANSMTLAAGAQITVASQGYVGGRSSGNSSTVGYYNGNVLNPGRNYYLGGTHGGQGGWISDYGLGFNAVYGSQTAPTLPGGGGNVSSSSQTGGNGGGVVRLDIANALVLQGLINANGQGGSGYVSGGAGGSVYVTAGSISGPGTAAVITANGGAGVTYGRGGGGRVALRGALSGWTVSNTTVQANGGTGGTGNNNGQNGTVYYAP